MKQFTWISCSLVALSCLLMGCKPKTASSTDLSSIHTTAQETMANQTSTETISESPEESTSLIQIDTAVTTAAPSAVQETDTANSNSSSQNVTPKIETYSEQAVNIQFPVISKPTDESKQNAINDLLKSNALSILTSDQMNQEIDQIDIKCKIVSADRNRVTAVYTGTYQKAGTEDPIQLFYANTVDLNKVCSLGFNDYADAYTMAGYLLSDDCTFYQTSKEKAEQLNLYKKQQDLSFYSKLFTEADFPSNPSFPESFSYENQGILYFSIPVSHELGDYAIVSYQVDLSK